MSDGTYNIWYHRYSGTDKDPRARVKAKTRCCLKTDAGYTRAKDGANTYFCLYFARGSCTKGWECTYLHRVPLPEKDRISNAYDCFGRERHGDHRDDMDGVGTFNKDCRTIYVNGISAYCQDMEKTIRKHFGDWGAIDNGMFLNKF